MKEMVDHVSNVSRIIGIDVERNGNDDVSFQVSGSNQAE
jgi:hypothetical protein